MQLNVYIGAVLLLAMALTALPALWIRFKHGIKPLLWMRPAGSTLWGLVWSELGAVSVLYSIRGPGVTINASATAPTAAQAQQVYKQSAKVVFGVTADAQALFTHNWGLDISAVTYFEPEVFVNPISTTTYWPLLTFDWTSASNVMIINKPATDAPTTVIVTIRRPQSLGQ